MGIHHAMAKKKEVYINLLTTKHFSTMKGSLKLFIREDLLSSLPPSHSVLLGFSLVGGRKLLLLLRLDDGVTQSVVLDLVVISGLLVNPLAGALTFDPVVSRSFEITLTHGPDFGTNRLGELSVVSNNKNTTLEVLKGRDKGSEGLSVEIVGRLVETDDVGSSPGSGTEDDLNLLTTGKTSHGVVGNEFGVESSSEYERNILTSNSNVTYPKSSKCFSISLLTKGLIRPNR